MTMPSVSPRLGFKVKRSVIRNFIYTPRYYDLAVSSRVAGVGADFQLLSLGSLIDQGYISTATGHEIGKMAYGTGQIPFVRTSDISNWEIKADPKQSVSQAIYESYAGKQDIQAGDILFVRDGTYLIGTACMVGEDDLPLLYQSHLLRIRVNDDSPVSAPLLLLLLTTDFVKAQVRSKQFTADIIDTLGDRFRELMIPVPNQSFVRTNFEYQVLNILRERRSLLQELPQIPLQVNGPEVTVQEPAPPDSSQTTLGFTVNRSQITKSVLVPKYYSPEIAQALTNLEDSCTLTSISELVETNVLSLNTGVEVGKMAYGTGSVPFIRTSDIANNELKIDPKQSVSTDIALKYKRQLDILADDILLVRDGTYLVGNSCILTKHDTDILYCGGIYKLRVLDQSMLDPYLVFVLLNTPIVRRQMRVRQFTRDIIDTLGRRILEVQLPIPKDGAIAHGVASEMKTAIQRRAELRESIRELVKVLDARLLPSPSTSPV